MHICRTAGRIFNVVIFILLYNIAANAQIHGCTDPPAINYNPSATVNDGSCIYSPASVIPDISLNLDNKLDETSGLIIWNDRLWTHNDSDDINIYSLDTVRGNIIQSYPLKGTVNRDWEEISQDRDFIYIGDFGNNSTGMRTDLMILRISKSSISINQLIIDTISFSYPDQTNPDPPSANNTDFDCEAFIVSADSIYLFTKQWISKKTTYYSLPKIPGTYVAVKRNTLDVRGLITGAEYLESERLIALCGYTHLLEPFIFLLYDFDDSDFFSGNKRRIDISLPFHQVEGIATSDGLKYYISNEYFRLMNIPQKLHVVSLNPFLQQYLKPGTRPGNQTGRNDDYKVYLISGDNCLVVKKEENDQNEDYSLISLSGQTVLRGKLNGKENMINISHLTSGLYVFRIGKNPSNQVKLIKI